MTNKNLEKLAEIGERKLFDDLDIILIDIKKSLMDIKQNIDSNSPIKNYLNEKIEFYKKLITTCKSYGLNVNGSESIFNKMVENKSYIFYK